MPHQDNYPATVAEVLDDRATFLPDALRAVKRFRRTKPWQGGGEERLAKLWILNGELARAYDIPEPRLTVALRGGDWYNKASHVICLSPRLSVVTFLHEFAHARGMDERRACRWSLNLFRRCFPRSFARCRQVGHTLVR